MTYNLTHARHDPAHCLAPGLFRSLRKGERKTTKLDVTFKYGDDFIRFWGPEPLGADDLRILQGLVAMTAVSGDSGRGIMLRHDTENGAGQQLRLWLDLKWEALEMDVMVAKGSYRQLAKELGYAVDSGSVFNTIRDSIERLWAVSVIVERGGARHGFRIISSYASNKDTGKLFVAINPRLAEAIMGDRRHVRIDMAEVRALQSDPARLIHQRLCGWIDCGKEGKIEIDKLAAYIWPEAGTPTTMRRRRKTVKNALAELAGIGWGVQEYAKGKWSIERPDIYSPCLIAHAPMPYRSRTHALSLTPSSRTSSNGGAFRAI